jgi:hypothetical protein
MAADVTAGASPAAHWAGLPAMALMIGLAGCTPRAEPATDPVKTAEAPAAEKKPVALAGPQQLTLHVPEMTEKLHLT